MPGHVNIGKIDQLIREKYGTYAAFCKESGFTRQYLSELLRGKIDPSVDRLVHIADLLGVCVDDIVIRRQN